MEGKKDFSGSSESLTIIEYFIKILEKFIDVSLPLAIYVYVNFFCYTLKTMIKF